MKATITIQDKRPTKSKPSNIDVRFEFDPPLKMKSKKMTAAGWLATQLIGDLAKHVESAREK